MSAGADKEELSMSTRLIGAPTADTPWHKRPRPLLVNFLAMALCFSLNHGTVTAVLALASSYLGKTLGGYSSGTLYVLYTVSALTVAAGLVQRTGAKLALAIGLGLYCFYTGSFLVASEAPSAEWYAAILGSVVGGFAAGWLWTAQGAFFARTAQLYSEATKQDISKVNGYLAGLFSTAYVGLEVLCKGASSLLHRWGGDSFVYSVLTIAAVASAAGMIVVRELPPENSSGSGTGTGTVNSAPTPNTDFSRKITLAIKLLIKDPKMKLLTPMNAAFGFTASFMNFYVNGTPVKNAIGENNVGYMAAVTPLVATVLSLPYAAVTARVGKMPMMVFGALNYTTMAVSVWAMSESHLEGLGWGLIFLYILGGSGRAVFESTNKATFADFFPDDKEAAFANVIVQSGGASAFAFFLFPHLTKLPMALITAITGVLAMVCLVAAFRIHAQGLDRKAEEQLIASTTGTPVTVRTSN